ncbi:DUF4249 domain-containing protein [Bacteroidota bacterium]
MSKLLSICIILLCTVSCIERFHPDIKERVDKLVINGSITDRPGWHYVEVSRASPYNEPGFIPVEGCVVRVEDENGQGVTYSEYQPGVHRADLNESFLGVNKAYKLFVYTPDGEEYQSEYDPLLPCPPIDSLYYQIEWRETENPDVTYPGIQFYVDVKGKADDSRNFLWKLEETFEYRAPYIIQYIKTDVEVLGTPTPILTINPPIDILSRCYKTNSIAKIHVASTRQLVINEINEYPLNFVGAGPQLKIKYGLVVKQYSLSDDAFLYWEKMNNMMSETGGLYEKQPERSDGNIYNVNDEEERILGFFYASQEREKLFITKNPGFAIQNYYCPIDTLPIDSVSYYSDLPVGTYMISVAEPNEEGEQIGEPYGTSYRRCFDCRERGGSLEPPLYWLIDE